VRFGKLNVGKRRGQFGAGLHRGWCGRFRLVGSANDEVRFGQRVGKIGNWGRVQ
jgi:hypothetical protein